MLIEAHPDRYEPGGRRGVTPNGVVVHTVEGYESMAGIRALMTRPGDRPRSNPTPTSLFYGASYDAIANDDGGYDTVILGADGYPYSAPPLNKYWLHIVMPGYSAQKDDATGWRDPFSLAAIRGVAKYIVAMSSRYGFPIHRTNPQEMRDAGVEGCKGYCGHVDVSYAFGKTDHTDPGPNFPWDVLAAEIEQIQRVHVGAELPEEEMAVYVRSDAPGKPDGSLIDNGWAVFEVSTGRLNHINGEVNEVLKAAGFDVVPKAIIVPAEKLNAAIRRAGLA